MTFPKRRRKESRCLTKWQLNNQIFKKKRRIITKGQIQCHSWWMDQLFLFFLICSGLEKGFTLDVITRGAVNNHFFCVHLVIFGMVTTNQPTERTTRWCKSNPALDQWVPKVVFCKNPFDDDDHDDDDDKQWWAKFFGQSGKRWRLIERELCHQC